MNKFHAVILASVMVSSFAQASQPSAAPVDPKNAPKVTLTEPKKDDVANVTFLASVLNALSAGCSVVTSPVTTHPYVSSIVALSGLAAAAYFWMNTEDQENEDEEAAQF